MKYDKLTDEDLGSMQLGFLPATEHILTIITNTIYYAVTEEEGEEGEDGEEKEEAYCMLVGWAYLKNGVCMPLIYDHVFHTLRNPEVLENFIRIDDTDYPEEGEGEEEKYEPKV